MIAPKMLLNKYSLFLLYCDGQAEIRKSVERNFVEPAKRGRDCKLRHNSIFKRLYLNNMPNRSVNKQKLILSQLRANDAIRPVKRNMIKGLKMLLKYSAVGCGLACLVIAGCQTGNSIWSKPGYQAAPVNNSASRTYTPTQSVSPYQQGSSSYGGSGTSPNYAAPSYGGSGSSAASYGGSGGR